MSRSIALCSIFSALGAAALMLGMGFIDISSAGLAAFAVALAYVEFGGVRAFLVYAVTAAAALILAPVKTGAVLFMCFFGHYPIFKSFAERFHPAVAMALKFSYFNIFFAAAIYIGARFFSVADSMLTFRYEVFALANLAFLLYDIAMGRIILMYLVKIRPRISKGK